MQFGTFTFSDVDLQPFVSIQRGGNINPLMAAVIQLEMARRQGEKRKASAAGLSFFLDSAASKKFIELASNAQLVDDNKALKLENDRLKRQLSETKDEYISTLRRHIEVGEDYLALKHNVGLHLGVIQEVVNIIAEGELEEGEERDIQGAILQLKEIVDESLIDLVDDTEENSGH